MAGFIDLDCSFRHDDDGLDEMWENRFIMEQTQLYDRGFSSRILSLDGQNTSCISDCTIL